MNRWEKPSRLDRFRHRKENPSFSSTLLDSIYRSIDQTDEIQTMKKKQSNGCKEEVEKANHQRSCMIEKWMEKKVNEKVIIRRKSVNSERKSRDSVLMNSSSSSSDSSYGGGISSNDLSASSFQRNFGFGVSSNEWCAYRMDKPKLIRTSIPSRPEIGIQGKNETGYVKTKSKALKFYGDLKKVKQPISPGGRLASFLNSIFNGGNQKKVKISDEKRANSVNTSTCSSASSYSRSCLSKTPSSSTGKLSNGIKRSVRFVDEDHFIVKTSINNEAMEFLKNYQNTIDEDDDGGDDDDDDDDDDVSCSSSDLFELENICGNGIERYREELPVYETTHFHTNRAILNGLI